MPSIITHGVVAVAAGAAAAPRDVPSRFWALAIVVSAVPDLDVAGFACGIQYGDFFGHRGFFHSIFFGLLLGLFVALIFFREERVFSRRWFFYAGFFSLVAASHGILDAFTNGGLGIALLSPFDETRYFFPWQPIQVSPIGAGAFFSEWGLRVIRSEFLWVWIPCLLAAFIIRGIRFSWKRPS